MQAFLPGDVARNRQILMDLNGKYKSFVTSITESYLREELVLEDNVTNYEFALNDKKASALFDQLLSQQDAFVITQVGLMLKRCLRTDEVAIGGLQTYVNQGIFTGGTYNVDHLNALYEGKLTFSSNQREFYSSYPALAFKHVPAQQRGEVVAAYLSAAPAEVKYAKQDSEFQYGFGLQAVEPRIILFGDSDNKWTLKIPAIKGLDIQETNATHDNRVVLYAHGFRLAGAARNREKIFKAEYGL